MVHDTITSHNQYTSIVHTIECRIKDQYSNLLPPLNKQLPIKPHMRLLVEETSSTGIDRGILSLSCNYLRVRMAAKMASATEERMVRVRRISNIYFISRFLQLETLRQAPWLLSIASIISTQVSCKYQIKYIY